MSTPALAAPPARPAASVLLLRDAPDGPEVFHVRRASTMDFSADATAFPGGGVDPTDAGLPLHGPHDAGPDLSAWARRLRLAERPVEACPGQAPADVAGRLLAAAVREVFEETGVLLARGSDGTAVDAAAAARLGRHRGAVERHETSFADLLAVHGLHADVSGLRAVSRWITPVGASRRYDTVFFLARLPHGQSPHRLSAEAAAHGWAAPRRLLADFRRGLVHLMAPTWAQLRALHGAPDVASALAGAEAAGPVPVVQVAAGASPAERAAGFAHAEEYLADLERFRARAQVAQTPDNIL
ncbi:NUDIX hydrolase [Micrococcus sp.]|uniref:NUDIX hydrolase n=1 Tax=Micrococcus sp. TaxID=1271 RepID=UPI002A91560E|nr:NUDIX hydrolase [Micrococcus sp.]MDY6056105.1 NUDIX hydrolase [Micrococcus sp.]